MTEANSKVTGRPHGLYVQSSTSCLRSLAKIASIAVRVCGPGVIGPDAAMASAVHRSRRLIRSALFEFSASTEDSHPEHVLR